MHIFNSKLISVCKEQSLWVQNTKYLNYIRPVMCAVPVQSIIYACTASHFIVSDNTYLTSVFTHSCTCMFEELFFCILLVIDGRVTSVISCTEMEDSEEALTFTADYMSDVGSVPDDCVSEGSDASNRRFATFSLSMSDFGDYDDRRSEPALDDDYTDDIDDVTEPDRTPFWRREKRLSRILGISADERCEKQLMQGGAVTDDLLQDIGTSQRFPLRPGHIDIGQSESTEFSYLESGPIRRCTSLKTSKTPPGTPRHKKEVRFADALGLDLASIKQILNQEDPPIVPDSAVKGLNVDEKYYGMWQGIKGLMEPVAPVQRVRHLCACFAQPGYSPDFARRVEERRVSLEHCTVDDVLLMVSGTVRVANISFEKHVAVRYTINGWMTYTDELAKYCKSTSTSDQFTFKIHLPDYFDFSSRMEFSVMYVAAGQTYWDSNFGANYRIECHVEESPAAVRRVDAVARLTKETSRHPFY